MKKHIGVVFVVLLLAACTPTMTVRSSVEPVKPGNSRSTDVSVIEIDAIAVATTSYNVRVSGVVRNISNHDVCVLRVNFEVQNSNGKFLGTVYDWVADQACIAPGGRTTFEAVGNAMSGATQARFVSCQWRPMSID